MLRNTLLELLVGLEMAAARMQTLGSAPSLDPSRSSGATDDIKSASSASESKGVDSVSQSGSGGSGVGGTGGRAPLGLTAFKPRCARWRRARCYLAT